MERGRILTNTSVSYVEANHVVRNKKKNKSRPKLARNKEFLVIMYLFLALFLGLMAYFVYFQVYKSEAFINSPYNSLQDLFSERVKIRRKPENIRMAGCSRMQSDIL